MRSGRRSPNHRLSRRPRANFNRSGLNVRERPRQINAVENDTERVALWAAFARPSPLRETGSLILIDRVYFPRNGITSAQLKTIANVDHRSDEDTLRRPRKLGPRSRGLRVCRASCRDIGPQGKQSRGCLCAGARRNSGRTGKGNHRPCLDPDDWDWCRHRLRWPGAGDARHARTQRIVLTALRQALRASMAGSVGRGDQLYSRSARTRLPDA
jgi:hypothetical protein